MTDTVQASDLVFGEYQGATMRHKLATNWKWILIGLAAIPTIHIYYVQELIAALIIFSLLFLGITVVVFFLFVLDRVSEQIIVWVEVGIGRIAHWVFGAVERFIATPAFVQAMPHRSRKGQLGQNGKN